MNKIYKFIIAVSFLSGSLVIASRQSQQDRKKALAAQNRAFQEHRNAVTLSCTLHDARIKNQRVQLPVGASMSQKYAVEAHNAEVPARALFRKNK